MNTIKISYDQQSFHAKPSGDEIRWINNRIARSAKKLDKNPPTAIICDQNDNNIIAVGGIFPNKYYQINFNTDSGCTRHSSVKTPDERSRNHKKYRSGVLQDMNSCRLFRDFNEGSRKLSHDELFGIATNLIQIEGGTKYFLETISEYPELYTDDVRNEKWKADLSYMSDYHPESCDRYCSYRDECIHCKSILGTVHPERGVWRGPQDTT